MRDRGRTRRGTATREKIVRAATRLFTTDGYVTTTVGDIAAEAGVAVQTLYLAFGSKVAILSAAHDVAIVGDDAPVPLLERDWVAQLAECPDAMAGWRHAVRHMWESTGRVAPIYRAIHAAAADPAVAELVEELHRARGEFSKRLATLLLALPGARSDTDADRLGDVIYTVFSVDTHTMLVAERGWTAARWRDWVQATVAAELVTDRS
ncbi:TetR/AcrR family transcriptional regulator [Fodinicola acaciae]|uniref:TetR/AcrR family transcriptional regulator n=1 Tax=Fodinicola acaciae TaxID=2681555 RepID=UPI0013D36938|nr:TetR/AcrR family transcriptional regulator [Fodinicola acaciae]